MIIHHHNHHHYHQHCPHPHYYYYFEALKLEANGRYLVCKSSPYYFHLLYRSTFFLLSAKCMLGLCDSVIHRTLTWTTGSSACVRDHSCAWVYTRGLGTLTASQHNMFDSEKHTFFSSAPDGIRTPVLWILSPTHYQLSHPVTPMKADFLAEFRTDTNQDKHGNHTMKIDFLAEFRTDQLKTGMTITQRRQTSWLSSALTNSRQA